jgi:hypothetical protein
VSNLLTKIAIVLVLCVAIVFGCERGSDSGGQTADQFSYSVLTSSTGRGLDLLQGFRRSVLPRLEALGAQEYAIWSRATDAGNDFERIAEDELVIMLRWESADTGALARELAAMEGVSEVSSSLWEAALRGGKGALDSGSGFYVLRLNRYLNEHVDKALALSQQAWTTWEPFWDAEVPGVWRELDDVERSNGITRLMRIAWYRDREHWRKTRAFWLEPESLRLSVEQSALHLDDEGWSGSLQGSPAMLAPVTVAGAQLMRDGQPFRVFGVQNLDQTFRQALFMEGTPEQRATMRARLRAIGDYGANTLRLHLQLFDFVERDVHGKLRTRGRSFDNLLSVANAAVKEGIYLLLSANNAWVVEQVPAWYDAMSYRERWQVQAFFLGELARTMAGSPAVLGYELMSEPVIRPAADAPWYCGELDGYAFAQAIARGVPRDQEAAVARDWIRQLSAAVRAHDKEALLTFGAIGPFYEGALGVENTAPLLDFLSPHIYPDSDFPDLAMESVERYAASGKPVVIGETHVFLSDEGAFRDFLNEAAPMADGIISFFHDMKEPLVLHGGEHAPEHIVRVHEANQRIMQEMCDRILYPDS